jgi:hypothetical protein
MGDFMNFAGGMSYYYQMEQYLEFLSDILDGEPRVTHSRHQGRIYIFGEWAPNQYNNLAEGDYIMFEVLSLVDPSTFADVWNDKFLKDYTTQLIKQQWGMNMSKFEGMQLPGGVTLSGAQYYQDATAELERLEEKMRNENEFPPDFFMG